MDDDYEGMGAVRWTVIGIAGNDAPIWFVLSRNADRWTLENVYAG